MSMLDSFSVPPSPGEEGMMLDSETGALVLSEKVQHDDTPYFTEKW